DCKIGFAHPREDTESVEIWHDEIEHDSVDACSIGASQKAHRRIPAFDRHSPVSETLDHGFEEPALDRIVVYDENHFRHWTPHARLCRIGAMSLLRLNGLLSGTRVLRALC